jgi:hypothetical protein
MKGLGPIIDKTVRLEHLDPALIEGLERLRSVLTFCGKRLGGTDPLTIPPAPLDAITGSLESVKVELEAFLIDRSAAHLTSANGAADTALVNLAQIPGITTREELVGLIQAANSHRNLLEQQAASSSESRKKAESEIKELKSKLDEFSSQTQMAITALQSQLDAERQRISVQSSEQQKTFAEAQESRGNTYNETLRKVQESLSQTITDQQRQFSEAQENRIREFTAAQTDSQKRLTELVSDYTKRLTDQDAEFAKQRVGLGADATKRLEELQKNYSDQADGILKKINMHREEVETLVGVIATLGVTSGYQKTADSARKRMMLWQGVGVVALVAVILFAYKAFLPSMQGILNGVALRHEFF